MAWATELVKKGRFSSVRFVYLTVGHTKFDPDKLFSKIAHTFYKLDVFSIEMLHAIAVQHSTSLPDYYDNGRILEKRYSAIPRAKKWFMMEVTSLFAMKTMKYF